MTVGRIAGTGWVVLDVAPSRADYRAHWAPDGRHFVLTSGRADRPALLFNIDGTLVRELHVIDSVAWLGPADFLLISRGNPQDAGPVRNAGLLGSIGSPELAPIELPAGIPFSNDHGAVAFGWRYHRQDAPCAAGACRPSDFVIWTPQATTDVREGYPLGWSADGDRLVVVHLPYAEGGPGGYGHRGWAETLTWPGFERIPADRLPHVRMNQPQVSLSGRYVVYREYDGRGTVVNIADLATGATPRLRAQGLSTIWLSADRLVLSDFLAAAVYDIKGKERGDLPGIRGHVAGAGDGSALATTEFYYSTLNAHVIRDDQPVEVEPLRLLGVISCSTEEPSVAPKGAALFIKCAYNAGTDGYGEFALLRPL